jgi:hypothetical protein
MAGKILGVVWFVQHPGSPVKSGRHIGKEKPMNYRQTGNRKRVLLDDEAIWEIRKRLAAGELQHDIAADLGINQGRVSEVKTGKRRPANDNWVGN